MSSIDEAGVVLEIKCSTVSTPSKSGSAAVSEVKSPV